MVPNANKRNEYLLTVFYTNYKRETDEESDDEEDYTANFKKDMGTIYVVRNCHTKSIEYIAKEYELLNWRQKYLSFACV